MTDRELSSLMAGAAGYTEAQLVVLVLSMVVVFVALLSYFVVAPEYEKHLDKKFAAMVHASSERQLQNQQAQELLLSRLKLRKFKSLGAWDIESGSSDDDVVINRALQRRHTHRPLPASISSPRDMQTEAARIARRERNARRRKSESDAFRQTSVVQRADVLRRRVLLRELEEEIAGTVKANEEAQAAAINKSNANQTLRSGVWRLSNDALNWTDDRLKMLQEHPADCVEELTVLTRAQATTATWPLVDNTGLKIDSPPDVREVKRALNVLHDVLSFYLSVDHRDMNKLTVFCNSLLQHDGLNRLRAFEASRDQDIRSLSNSIIEKAVPAIWH